MASPQLAPLHTRTPLIYSSALSRISGANIYLKLENTQASGSFKLRGIGLLASQSLAKYGPDTNLICSSTGNAGLACAYAAQRLGVKCTVFAPITTKRHVLARLQDYGAEVVVSGRWWSEADEAARKQLEVEEKGVYVHPYDHPSVFEGHATMIDELTAQVQEQNISNLSGVICSIGGGGLISGILLGLKRSPLLNVPVLATETYGAAALSHSLRASASNSQSTLSSLSEITSIASSLGALRVSQTCLDLCLSHPGEVISVKMEDKDTVDAALQFLDNHSILVEPGCSASLVPIYSPSVLKEALPDAKFSEPGSVPDKDAASIVVIVCGGLTVKIEDLVQWEKELISERGVEVFRK